MTSHSEASASDLAPACICDGNGWVPCFLCSGDGCWHDCGEDICVCREPEYDVACEACNGTGTLNCPAHDAGAAHCAAPVVFLDFDGVINHSGTYADCAKRPGQTVPADWIDRACIARVDALCARTGAELVIISSWSAYLTEIQLDLVMRVSGLVAPIVGYAPSTCPREVNPESTTVRWDAVRRWLDAHPEANRWVILDDCDWQGFPPERFVRTAIATGLTDADVERAARILASEVRDGQ